MREEYDYAIMLNGMVAAWSEGRLVSLP
jgi:hypothetical protein